MEIVQYKDSKEWSDMNYEFRLVVGNSLLKNGIVRVVSFNKIPNLLNTYVRFKLELK